MQTVQSQQQAFEIMRHYFHRQGAHRRGDRRPRSIHEVDVLAADDRTDRQLAAQDAKLQIDPLAPVVSLFDAVYQRGDADAFARMRNQQFLHRLGRAIGSKADANEQTKTS